MMGPGWPDGKPFPILVKWLDCRERLSLQVHPPAGIAEKLGGEPKTENWYVVETTEDAQVFAGLKNGVTREQFEAAMEGGALEGCVHSFPSQPGDSLLVESGRLHAIDAGNLILEVQQNSDTTYRVYDWGRVGLNGQPRDLHVAETLQSMDFNDFEPSPLRLPEVPGESIVLADCDEFKITRHVLASGDTLDFPAGESCRLLHVVSGKIQEAATSKTYTKGANPVLPYSADCGFEALEGSTVLVTVPKPAV